jgi:hypothetical protein
MPTFISARSALSTAFFMGNEKLSTPTPKLTSLISCLAGFWAGAATDVERFWANIMVFVINIIANKIIFFIFVVILRLKITQYYLLNIHKE